MQNNVVRFQCASCRCAEKTPGELQADFVKCPNCGVDHVFVADAYLLRCDFACQHGNKCTNIAGHPDDHTPTKCQCIELFPTKAA